MNRRFDSSLNYGPVGEDGLPNYVYYNATVINTTSGVTTEGKDQPDPQVRFSETRDVPIIENTDKYDMSIVRFTLDGPNKDLPLFIPAIRTGSFNPGNNVNLTVYSITLSIVMSFRDSLGNTYTSPLLIAEQPLIYVPETKDLNFAPIPQPSTCQTGQDISTRYYWVYTYGHWLDLVDNTFAAAKANLQGQINTWWATTGSPDPAPFMISRAPEMTYNPTNNLFTIYADRYGYGGTARTSAGSVTQDENIKIYFNSNMFGLFSNFQNYYVNLDQGRTNEIVIYSTLNQNILNVVPSVGAPYQVWIITQDYSSTSTLWSPIESIVFTTSLLPVLNEANADPVRFGQDNLGNNVSSRPAFQPILTDIAVFKNSSSDYRQYIEYIPTAEYRMTSLTNGSPVTSIDIQVWWKNRLDGQLYPVQMFNLSSVTFKILFRKKGMI